jgi:hypothetical protein
MRGLHRTGVHRTCFISQVQLALRRGVVFVEATGQHTQGPCLLTCPSLSLIFCQSLRFTRSRSSRISRRRGAGFCAYVASPSFGRRQHGTLVRYDEVDRRALDAVVIVPLLQRAVRGRAAGNVRGVEKCVTTTRCSAICLQISARRAGESVDSGNCLRPCGTRRSVRGRLVAARPPESCSRRRGLLCRMPRSPNWGHSSFPCRASLPNATFISEFWSSPMNVSRRHWMVGSRVRRGIGCSVR